PLPPPPSLVPAPAPTQPPPSFFQPPPLAQASSVPPPPPTSVRSLLPPQPSIPPPPRTPSNLSLSEPSFALKDTDSVRPLAVDTWARRASVLRRGLFAPWQLAVAALCGGGALLASYSWWEGRHGELVVDIADQQCGS